jgi:pimeloyl-ACP methyl ester carboxylesterase
VNTAVRRVVTLLLSAVAIWLALAVLVWWQQDRLLFPGAGRGDRGVPTLHTTPGLAWLGDGEQRTRLATIAPGGDGRPRAVALYLGGNGEDLYAATYSAAELAGYGMEVVACEYPGFGASAGRPSRDSVLATAAAAAARAQARATELRVPLIVVGSSLGTFAAVHVAAAGIGDKLVLRAPPTRIADVARASFWWLPVGLLLAHRFDNLELADRVRCPTLVLHGEDDGIVPQRFGRELAAAIPGALFVSVPHRGHNDLELSPLGAVGPVLRTFLALP